MIVGRAKSSRIEVRSRLVEGDDLCLRLPVGVLQLLVDILFSKTRHDADEPAILSVLAFMPFTAGKGKGYRSTHLSALARTLA